MCDCITRVEKMLNEKLIENHPEAEITEPVSLKNKVYIIGTGKIQVYVPAVGRFLDGKRKRKFDVSMNFTFCPFCGVKYGKLK